MNKKVPACVKAIQDRMPSVLEMLPAQVNSERFKKNMLEVVSRPEAQKIPLPQLISVVNKAASAGLMLDNREAAIVMFGQQATYMPMVTGIIKMMRNSGELKTLTAEVVYENDEFDYHIEQGIPQLYHKPLVFGERGEPRGAYATAVLKDGSVMTEVMSCAEIEKVRAASRASKNGPWVNWWSEMARKTVIRRLSKRMPMSADVADVITADDDLYDMNGNGTYEAAPTTEQVPTEDKSKRTRAASVVMQQEAEVIDVEPEPQPEQEVENVF